MNYLIDVLRGKIDERITQLGHDKLSVFGVGHAHTIDIWRGVFRQLIAQGYLSVDTEGFGGLALCERCRPLLRSEEALWLRQITKPVKISRKTCDRPDFFSDEESELWEALRACRK
ncbi:MAG: ATP-dependent DNA helicase RecQ, partial [Halothiobacillus sp. 15-55-196]|uniref:RQC domain-containing protein n=1 Tax=Halothiobacillus sp. 15-55-196 TaxID=1970382 RepID=UPI000BDD2A25